MRRFLSYPFISIFLLSTFLLICCNDQLQPQETSPSVSKTSNQTITGKKEGHWKQHHTNGNLKSEGMYIDNHKEGKHKTWAEDGTLIEEAEYVKGKQTGITTWYHPGGHVAGSGNMVDGVRQGPWKICDIKENGFCIDANFKDGKREGVWKIYHDNTNIWKEQTFKDDKVVGEKCWDENGILISCE